VTYIVAFCGSWEAARGASREGDISNIPFCFVYHAKAWQVYTNAYAFSMSLVAYWLGLNNLENYMKLFPILLEIQNRH
jgi:hypothetical protein